MKDMKGMKGGMCNCCGMSGSQCMCGTHRWCKVAASVVAVVLGLLLIWPSGWFTFEHTVGLLVVLVGLKKLAHVGKHCC